MHFSLVIATLLAPAVSARWFYLHDDANFKGPFSEENQSNANCWNLNGKGDRTSSVTEVYANSGCTTFYRERDCTGSQWQFRGNAATVPSFLNDHIWSYKNAC